jgi:hypothetical protein
MGEPDVSRSRWYMLFRTASPSRMEMAKPEPKNAKSTNNFAGLSLDRDSFLTRHSRTFRNTKVCALQLLKRAPGVLPTWQFMSSPELSVDRWGGRSGLRWERPGNIQPERIPEEKA